MLGPAVQKFLGIGFFVVGAGYSGEAVDIDPSQKKLLKLNERKLKLLNQVIL